MDVFPCLWAEFESTELTVLEDAHQPVRVFLKDIFILQGNATIT